MGLLQDIVKYTVPNSNGDKCPLLLILVRSDSHELSVILFSDL